MKVGETLRRKNWCIGLNVGGDVRSELIVFDWGLKPSTFEVDMVKLRLSAPGTQSHNGAYLAFRCHGGGGAAG